MLGISKIHPRPTEHGREGRGGVSAHTPRMSTTHSHPTGKWEGREAGGAVSAHMLGVNRIHSLSAVHRSGGAISAYTPGSAGSTHVLQNTGEEGGSQRTRITRQHSPLTHKDGKYIKHDCITLTPPSVSNFGMPLIVLKK